MTIILSLTHRTTEFDRVFKGKKYKPSKKQKTNADQDHDLLDFDEFCDIMDEDDNE